MAINIKTIVTLALIILLIQCSLTKPISSPGENFEDQYAPVNKLLNYIKNGEANDEANELLTPKEKLLMFSLKEFVKLSDYFEEASKQLVESTLKDEDIVNSVDENVIEFKKQLQNYLDVMQNAKTFPERLNIMQAFSNVVNDYDLGNMIATRTEKQKILSTILNKHGLEKLNHDFGVKFLNALDAIFTETEKYIKDIKPEDVENIKRFTNLMESLKAKETHDDKLKYVFDYIDKDDIRNENKQQVQQVKQ